jgi:hypothetical protein
MQGEVGGAKVQRKGAFALIPAPAYTFRMSRRALIVLTVVLALAGVAGLGYVIYAVPPYDDAGDLSVTALLIFFGSLFLLTAAAGSLLALALHRRWPALAGQRQKLRWDASPPIDAALRQGILLGLVVATLTALSILRILDITFALVTVLLASLIEAFAQMRQ